MVRQWMKLVRITPLILGIICFVPQIAIIAPAVMAQDMQRNQEAEAQNLLMEGIILREQGTEDFSLVQALAKFQQAVALFRAIANRAGELSTLNIIASTYLRLGQKQLAIDYYQQTLPLYRVLGDSIEERLRQRQGEADNLDSIGRIYDSLGQTPQALDYLQQALTLWREVGDRQGEVITLDFLAAVYNKIGKHQQALDYYQQALLIRRELGNSIDERLSQRSAEANTLNIIGEIYRTTGQYQQALDYYQRALLINKELGNSTEERLGDRFREAVILNNIGIVYRLIGQPQQALNFYQQALPMMRAEANSTEERLRQRDGEAGILNNIGLAYDELKQPDQALAYYQQSLPITREIGNRIGEATALNNIGAIYERLGQPQQALDYYQQALGINQEIGDRTGEAGNLNNIGIVYDGLGQLPKAVDYYQRSLLISQKVGDRDGEANTLYNLASAQKNLNNFPEALQSIQAAIVIVEDIRGQLVDPDARTSYFASVQSYYKLQVDLLMELHKKNPNQGYAAQAFNVTERSKARTLLELLTESKADIRTGVDPQLLQQEQDIQRQLTALDKRRIELANASTNKEQIATLESQRETLQTQYRTLQSQIRTTSPKYAALKYPQPLTLEQIQQQILDDNTVILSYSLGKDRSYLWLIGKTEMISSQLPAGKIIEDLINQKVRPQLTNPRANRDGFLSATSELSNILLKPVLEKVSNKRIVIIGDGALQYLPFGALPDPRAENNQYQPLLVNNEVVYLPSASTLQTIRNETQNRTPAPKTLAVLADPVFTTDDQRVSQRSSTIPNNELPLAAQNLDRAARNARGEWSRLPGTRRESETILNLVPSSQSLALLDFQANRANALSNQLSQYRFIHWATHGFANAQKPELSGIVMSLVQENGQKQDGYLLLGDIFNLNFNADLVVLSACETGLGEVVQGEGLIGLTRGLMYAGTTRVVTSLWAVPDEETATLMGSFYGKMLQQNKPPAEALRSAQLEMWRSRSWVAPYYWAAFTLQGEWR